MILDKLPQAMVFDLDGTLAHTLPQLKVAVCKVAEQMHLGTVDDHIMSEFVGNGVKMLLGRVLLGRHDITLDEVPLDKMQEARQLFNRYYMEGLHENFSLYDGVEDGLKLFKHLGIKLAVVTNKPQMFAKPLLGFMAIDHYFDEILGGEVIKERKPDPAPVKYVLDKMGVAPEHSVMVGDSINDVKAGQALNMVAIALTYGYNGGYDLHTCCSPDYLFDSFRQINDLILSLAPR